jgi:hypothetical protein
MTIKQAKDRLHALRGDHQDIVKAWADYHGGVAIDRDGAKYDLATGECYDWPGRWDHSENLSRGL